MEYKILEANGVDNENVDGSALNNFIASGENGIIKGVLNECIVYLVDRNTVAMDTGEILIQGFRVKILSTYEVSKPDSAVTTDYQLIGRITLTPDRNVQFEMICRVANSLRTDDLYKTESGIYEVEIAQFKTSLDGVIELKRTVTVLDLQSSVIYEATLAKEAAQKAEQQVRVIMPTVEKHSDQISRNTKQIENLESQISGDLIQVDTQIAYKTDVPLRSAPNALIEMFGGMSYKSKNLFDKSKVSVTETTTGFSFTNAGGDGQPVPIGLLKDITPSLKVGDNITFYADVINTSSLGDFLYLVGSASDWNEGAFHTVTESDLNSQVFAYGAPNVICEYNNLIITKIANIPYEPYFEGLRHTKPTAFKSFGANLWQQGDIVASGYNAEIKNVFENLTPDKPYSISWDYTSNGTEAAQDVIIVYTEAGGFNIANGASFTITQEQIDTFNTAYGYFGSDATSGSMTNIMLNQGETALPYMPLREPISFAIPNIDEIEYGIDGYYYNFVDWRNKLRHKRVVRGIISNVFKPENVYDNIQYFGFAKPADFIGYNSVSNAFLIGGIETRLTSSDWDNSAHIGTATGQASYESIWIGFPVGTTLEEAKAALEGKEWVYALAKEQVDGISHLLPIDNLVAVQRGGALSVESNYNGYALPRTIVYQLRAINRD